MQRRAFIIAASIIFAGGVALGLAAFAGDINLAGPKVISSTTAQPGRVAQETDADSQTAQFPNAGEIDERTETVSSAPATRSSFMASWNDVAGADGYLLDVSTSDSFSSYVEGYHDLDVGNVTGRVVTGLRRGTTYYYRVRPYTAAGAGSYSEALAVPTVPTTGLTIHATFDSSITGRQNAAAIQATINRAISIYESLFTDPITIQIRFRYTTTEPDGTTPLTGNSHSLSVIYAFLWNTAINALRADATTDNDDVAIASFPASALSQVFVATGANWRALGRNTPPAMFENGTVGNGGPYDGIVTLNSARPFQFSRPTNPSKYDAQRSIEHEIDQVMGFLYGASEFVPDSLFSWSSAGHRNFTTSGTRYFSINGGVTNIINFNQAGGDFSGWQSTACPQTHPYVQNAFLCGGQSSDISATSPEGIRLDVIGYDLVENASTNVPSDFNSDGHSDYLLYNSGTRQTVIWYMNNNTRLGGTYGPTLPGGWQVAAVEDFNRDGHPDYLLFYPATRQTVIWYMNNNVRIDSTYGPTPPGGWSVVAAGDFNSDGYPDYVLYNVSTRGLVIWYLRNNVRTGSASCPTPPNGWQVAAVGDFNRDGHPDFLLVKSATRETAIWYMNNNVRLRSAQGPTPPGGWSAVGAADFNLDGYPDYLLYNATTRGTVIWYLRDNVRIGSAAGPALPGGWTLVAP